MSINTASTKKNEYCSNLVVCLCVSGLFHHTGFYAMHSVYVGVSKFVCVFHGSQMGIIIMNNISSVCSCVFVHEGEVVAATLAPAPVMMGWENGIRVWVVSITRSSS